VIVRLARDADELSQALELRHRVFHGEQGVSPDADRDGRDDEALHVVALSDGAVRGTCRVLVEGGTAKLGRMVVERSDRRRGVGRAVLRAAERSARAQGARRAELHAQLAARDFYAREGYAERGEPFVEEGIDHVTMDKPLA
jgi:predicted GNAT family N-acyltransferase